jgi:acetylornithine deacetylase/succinyl-diaminopimelate desuccinylase-like protein
LYRLSQYETPLEVIPGVEKYFRDIARTYPQPRRGWLENVTVALTNPQARDWILSDPFWNAYLRTTISLTGLTGSNKTNVIPAEASAEVDVRLLPHQNADTVLAELKRVVGDTAVRFSTILAPKAPLESPVASAFVRAVEMAAQENAPGTFVTTPMLTGATDRPTYQKLGIATYGLDPFRLPKAERQRGTHGNDERISLDNIRFGVRFVYDVLRHVQ